MNTISRDLFYEAIKKTYYACIENSKTDTDMAISIFISNNESYVYAETRLISIKSFFKVKELKNEFSCIVKGKDLLNIVKCMKEDIEVELVPQENKLMVKSGESKVYLYTNALGKRLPREDIEFEPEGQCNVDLTKLKEVKHCINANADSRLRSVHMLISSEGTKIEATNGLNFSIRGKNTGTEFVIEEKFLDIITDIAEDNQIIFNYGKYKSGAEGVMISTNDSIITLPLDIRKYFNLKDFELNKEQIPPGTAEITLKREELADTLNLMNTFADYVEITIENNKPIIVKSIGVYGESEARVNANVQGLWNKISINFAIKSLLNALNAIEDDEVSLFTKGKNSGMHIIGNDYYEYMSAVS